MELKTDRVPCVEAVVVQLHGLLIDTSSHLCELNTACLFKKCNVLFELERSAVCCAQ